MTVGVTAAFRSTVLGSISIRSTALSPVSLSIEWHHFVDRLAPFHQQLRRHRDIVTAMQASNLFTVFFFPKSTLMVLLSSSDSFSQLVFINEGRLCYRPEVSLAM